MREYGFSLSCIFPYKDRILGSVAIGENTGQGKPVFLYILRSVYHQLSGTFELLFVAFTSKLISIRFDKSLNT